MLCDKPEGWWVGGSLKREGIYVYSEPIHIIVQQKPMQNCEAIMLKLKK